MDYQQANAKLKPQETCRTCGGALFDQPLFKYRNMPASAQGFLNASELTSDHGVDVAVCQCAACGLVQLNQAPVAYYKDVIRATAYSEEMRKFRLNQLADWCNQYQLNGKRVLEIGCGRGEYLTLLNEVGLDAHGIEHAAHSVDHCLAQGLKVMTGYLGDADLRLELDVPYHGFVCFNFMEHWPDPVSSLRALSQLLVPGAIGLMEVPNLDMMVNKGLFSEFIADHLLYFTEQTLRLFLESNGFEVLTCAPVWQDYILSAVVRKRSPTNLTRFANFQQLICQRLHAYLDRFPAQSVAVWGAGHQSLAVIALAEIANRVCYVVDSAPFKQGKYTPSTHLPIVAPQQLITQPVAAVIVMAASYSDEVARIIRHDYPQVGHVALLRDDGLEEV